MEGISKKTKATKKGFASLFTDAELKSLYKKYLVFLGIVEGLILVGCWVFQLGVKEYNHFGSVNVPFPWKMYFLIAFLAPVAITFLGGLLVVAFNKYVHGVDYSLREDGTGDEAHGGMVGQFQTVLNLLLRIPFLLSLLLLALGVGILYRIEDITKFLGNLGVISIKYIALFAAVIIAVGAVLWIVWMVLNYRLKRKDMEYRYRHEVMERTGVIFIDDKTVVNPEGRLLSSDATNRSGGMPLLPTSTPEEKREDVK